MKTTLISILLVGLLAVMPTQVTQSTAKPTVKTKPTSDVAFSIRAPLTVPAKRNIVETFPLRNYVFFEVGSNEIPNRYVKLTTPQAAAFEVEQLRVGKPTSQVGRSARQMHVYYNIINIVGYRLGRNPTVLVTLTGSSAGDGPEMGKEYAESVKRYLVDVFGIAPMRITTQGLSQPVSMSQLPMGKNDLAMVNEANRRVEIEATSSQLFVPLQLDVLQVDPLDSRLIFNVISEKKQPLISWSIKATNEKRISQYYGPFTRDQESISGNTILGTSQQGNYKFELTGTVPDGHTVRTSKTIKLVRNKASKERAQRFSILFDFNEPKVVDSYVRFLIEEVSPHIVSNSKVIIHGYTDCVGGAESNLELSKQRAEDIMQILEEATFKAHKSGVLYTTYAFGQDAENAPFANKQPEERYYNRTVIIDIVQPK